MKKLMLLLLSVLFLLGGCGLNQTGSKLPVDFNSPEEFHKWLFEFFENGNTITVMGEEIDYQYCIELI